MGVILPKPILSKIVDRAGTDRVAAACCSVNGYRNNFEDAHVLHFGPKRMLFGIFDGHSNDKCSNYIAEHLPRKVNDLASLTNEAIEDMCIKLDELFLEDVGDGGTTATFCIVEAVEDKFNVTVCNIGDSRTLVARGGRIILATLDHKPQNPEEKARIERCSGVVRMNRVDGDLAVSRAFGDATFKRNRDNLRNQKVIAVPDVSRIECQKDDVLIIACDGVYEGNYNNEEVVENVFSMLPPPEGDYGVVAARICDQAIRRGSKDNVSCMIVQFTNGLPMVQQHGERGFLPGPPFPKQHSSSRQAYGRMASLVNLSLAEALQMRYELFTAFVGNRLQSMSALKQLAFEMSDDVDVESERAFFGSGPTPGKEAAFFAALAE
jgi:protein phosphatase